MNCLAIDTGGNHLTVLLIKDGKVYKNHIENAMLKHSVTLMPEIENLLIKTDTKLLDIDKYCAVVGPGSFTGIRIGVSAIKALAYANNKKVFGVTSFLSLAYNSDEDKVLSVIDAKHGNFYVCGFDGKNEVIKPSFVSFDEVKTLAKGYTVVSDSEIGVEHIKGDYANGFEKAVLDNFEKVNLDIEELVPLYVKKSQAEEERNG